MIGTVTVLPVRSSVIVMVSGTSFPSSLTGGRGFLPGRDVAVAPSQRPTESDARARAAGADAPRAQQRLVAVLAAAQRLALVGQHGERRGDLAAGLGGVDDGVDVAALGGDVRVEQPLGVVGLERGPLLGRRPPLQDRRGLPGAHHGQLGPRPRQAHVVAHPLGVHDDVRAAVALAQDDADPRHRGPAVGEHELGAVADHAPPLEVLAGVEARRVDEREDRQVEGVAEGDEPGRLLRGRDVERAGERRSAGWRRCRSAGRRSSANAVTTLARPAVAQLEQARRRRRSRRRPGARRSCRSTSAGISAPASGHGRSGGSSVGQRGGSSSTLDGR